MEALDKWFLELLSVIIPVATATVYLSRQIDAKLSRLDPEHLGLMHRVYSLELWAASQGYHDGFEHKE